ncbi:MAG: hypothetical protein ACN6O6_13845 [Pseudomonas sp.]|uniref:hypothetical protein n=1 Tax=Pseudomonas sp. TaxID=306 RepID=UPI003D121EC5
MLEIMASPDYVLLITVALVAAGTSVLVLNARRGWGAIAAAFGLLCGVLAVLCSSHYLLFVWASDSFLAFPGLVLGLPLIYAGSLGLLAPRQRKRPLGAVALLSGGLTLLVLVDAQQLWPATFYRLHAAAMGYPDLVLHEGDDLGQHVPALGTRVIFKPSGPGLSCGLLADPDAVPPALSFRVDCQHYRWGQAMVAPAHEAFSALPALHGLAGLWEEGRPGEYSTLLGTTLSPVAIGDLQQLCPQEDDCLASKQAILKLVAQSDWSAFVDGFESEGGQLSRAYDGLLHGDRGALVEVLAQDVRARLEERVAGIVAVYADAQAHSLTLSNLAPSYFRPYKSLPLIDNSLDAWSELKKTLGTLPVRMPNNGTLGKLQNAVLIAVEKPEGGGVRLVYHTEVGRQSIASLVLFITPLAWLVLVLSVLVWRCFVRR